MKERQELRLGGVDLLRGLSALGIVGCHLNLSPTTEVGHAALSFCDMNVGVFAALAGFLMARSKASAWMEYVGRRARRLLPTYFAWTVVFLCASVLSKRLGLGAVKMQADTLSHWLSVLFEGGASCHLWFLICLFYAQCVIWPMLGKRRIGWWCVLCGFVLIVISSRTAGWYGTYPLRLLAFLISGLGVAGIDWSSKAKRWILLLLPVAIVLHILLRGYVHGFIRDWWVALPLTVAFSSLSFSNVLFDRVASFLNSTSFGIYLVHPLFTAGIGVVIRRFFTSPYGMIPVLLDWIVCWLLALLLTVALQRVPMFNKFVR